MTGDEDALDLERLFDTASISFARGVVGLEAGATLDHEAPLWRDAIVFVIAGELDVTCTRGEHHCFRQGDILCLARLPIRRAHNGGSTPARLLAVWRRTAMESLTGEVRDAGPSHRERP